MGLLTKCSGRVKDAVALFRGLTRADVLRRDKDNVPVLMVTLVFIALVVALMVYSIIRMIL